MAAPAVRKLQNLISDYSKSFNPQKAIIDQQIAANDQSGLAQEAGLAAKQATAFKGIEQAAQNKGMFFSGFSPDAQASYTADTYLPALAGLQSAIANTRTSLLGNRAGLDTQANNLALQAQEADRSALTAWQQAEAQRQFQAKQAAIDRQTTISENAKNRAASAAKSSSSNSTPSTAQFLVSAFSGYDPKTMKNYTEREVIPALMANYGISKSQASKLAYNYRKSNYNE